MPIMFLGFFNNYAAGLSYYYFLANMVTFGQQFVMRKYFIDEKAIMAQIENNKKKPVKKSKFQKRLEDMAKNNKKLPIKEDKFKRLNLRTSASIFFSHQSNRNLSLL